MLSLPELRKSLKNLDITIAEKKKKQISICRFCLEPIRFHSYKGWYHQDGKGKGHRDHPPMPIPSVAELQLSAKGDWP
jgi:hypothetical protein